jgi:hypothetical protein
MRTHIVALKFPKSDKYNFNKNLVKRHKLVTHLDQFLATEPERFEFIYEPKEKDDAWHPSGHCCPPPSALYAYVKEEHGAERDISASLSKTFMVGHFWHQLLQYAVVEIGLATPEAIERRGTRGWGEEEERTLESGRVVSWAPFSWATGSGDIAPCSIPTVGDFTVDFKTMSALQFKTAGIPDWAAKKYEAQINIYMDWFDTERALIVAINKDSPHDMKEFEFERNQPLIDAVYDKWEFVSECLSVEEIPSAMDDDAFSLEGLFTGPVAQ